MKSISPDRVPVILAIGEVIDRPADPALAREPVALMADALRAAQSDSGAPALLSLLDSVELVGQVSWRYRDPVGSLCERLGIAPGRMINASMGGETPIRLLHEAALRIAAGEIQAAAVVGGEAINALGKARQSKIKLDWTPVVSREQAARIDFESLPISAASKAVGVTDPVHIYPLYENALQAAQGETPEAGLRSAAVLWARYAAVAASNPYAWLRTSPGADEIATVSESNRLISYPYPKLMVANPSVNQAGAFVVTSLALARKLGVAEDRVVHIWGGAAAQEPGDYLARGGFDHSTAQNAVLEAAVELVGGRASAFDAMELYSCFPVVPKLALKTLQRLGIGSEVAPTAAGGLTFFGGPLNNYMTHAVCATVRKLRSGESRLALVYGQGGVVSKHHAVVLSSQPASAPLAAEYSVQPSADAARGAIPELLERYTGPAVIETHTVLYSSKGHALHGVVVLKTPAGERVMAKVLNSDAVSLALLLDAARNPIGCAGHVRIDTYDKLVWESGAARDRSDLPKKFCTVERDGHLTIVTINRPEAMNAFHPMLNEELAEVFDEFQQDPEQWVAILTGAGTKAFSSGNDLKHTAEAMARGEWVEPPASGFAGLTSRWTPGKPVIAAVNGVAMGGGFEVALACDLIIAAESAVFALPEPKVGLAALAGGLLRLPREIGLKKAMGLILTGRRIGAAEGYALGFVNEVVPAEALMATAKRWAEEIMACSPMSVRASKEAVLKGLDEPTLEQAYGAQVRYPAMRALFRSADIREGPLAFSQKRAPQWKGR
ncbi:MAG: enoyl-CoA hydratase [Hydrocarboniphaga sp.]|uniref:enoyl-CoA hydratase-related protein n=1 Tax=Hydrocarboniphaga sp. TaxID=2033016 RepID=UPI00262EE7A4|nr:enoyl-CoA hydratase-related protein [Hydrocarboniphaga sp.]MDB5969938.1 enoyl-CoA hydratase [Hydrocarboniphaga sp.]